MWTSNRRLYLDKDGQVVEDGDPAAVELLAGAWDRIPLQQAQDLGLADTDGNTIEPKSKKKG